MMQDIKGTFVLVFAGYLSFILMGFAFGGEKKPVKADVKSIVKHNSHLNLETKTNLDFLGTIKFEERFDDTTPPAGWQAIDGDSSGTTWEFYEDTVFTTGDTVRPQAGAAFWANNYTHANNFVIADWLLTPKLPTLESGDSLYVYVTAVGSSFPDTLTVWVSTTDSSISSFTSFIEMIVDPGPIGEWHLYALDIALGDSLAGEDVFVGFKHDHQDGGPWGSGSFWICLDHVILANGGLTAIDDDADFQPNVFVLKQNYPNPFNPATTISYDLHKNAEVTLKVFNLAGQEVKTLVNESQAAGSRQVTWDGKDNNGHRVASGIYLYQLQAGNRMQTKKMVLLK